MKLWFLALLCCMPMFCQPAPQRSEELCATLQQTAAEKGRTFEKDVPHAGACRMNLDTGYDLFVSYGEQTLALGLRVNAVTLQDANAFWLRLSALDNLAGPALGTKQQGVFDGLNKLAKKFARQQLAHGVKIDMQYDRIQRASLAVGIPSDGPFLIFMASAKVHDIDEMKRLAKRRDEGDIAPWRKILSTSLAAFGAGAQGYANGYRQAMPIYTAPRTCYTNFMGNMALTNCH